MDAVRVVATSRNEDLVGEWTFSTAAFPHHRTPVEDTIGRKSIDALRTERPDKWAQLQSVFEVWRGVRDLAPGFVDDTARRVLARRPRIVAAPPRSSRTPLRWRCFVVSRNSIPPSSRCWAAQLRIGNGRGGGPRVPSVDFAVSGEADEIFAPLCRLLLKKGAAVDPVMLPHGVLCARNANRAPSVPGRVAPPRAVVERIDASPVPDSTNISPRWRASRFASPSVPALPVESSRGCWWGQKSHCTFCGLNGEGMRFRPRARSGVERVHELAARYGSETSGWPTTSWT